MKRKIFIALTISILTIFNTISPVMANNAPQKETLSFTTFALGEYQAYVRTGGGNLNIRTGPGTNYSIVGKIADGSIIRYSYMNDAVDWDYIWGKDINGNSISGYAFSEYIKDY